MTLHVSRFPLLLTGRIKLTGRGPTLVLMRSQGSKGTKQLLGERGLFGQRNPRAEQFRPDKSLVQFLVPQISHA